MTTWADVGADAPAFAARVRAIFDAGTNKTMATLAPTLEPGPEGGPGDAKLAGRLVEIPPPPDDAVRGAGYFVLDIAEVVLTWVELANELLVVETWKPGRGWHERRRR